MKTAQDKTIALDGKTLKGARRENGTKVHLLSTFLHQQAITVGQIEGGGKTNEIPMAAKLLAPLDINGAVVTADAMHTQVDTARYIVEEKRADYLFIVQENQKNLLGDIALLKNSAFPPPPHQIVDKGHGRIEVRSLRASTLLNNYLTFPHCRQVIKIKREITSLKTSKVQTETVSSNLIEDIGVPKTVHITSEIWHSMRIAIKPERKQARR